MSMTEIDRMMAIVKPTMKFVDWINQHKTDDETITVEMVWEDCTALLIPEFESLAEAEQFIENIYPFIVENEIFDWNVDENVVPEITSYQEFKQWFEIKFHSLVL